jgi:DNA mismatch endonuclease (patch repair protein)
VIFAHGCFWHQHSACREGRIPSTRKDYWDPKLRRNVERDISHLESLRGMKWQVMIIWECEVNDANLPGRIKAFLKTP